MMEFTPGGLVEVHFDIVRGSSPGRREVRLPFDDYVELSKASKTIEELRVSLFLWKPGGKAAAQ